MKYDLDFFRGNAWDPFRLLQAREDKWIPACDVDENENRYLVTVDLPGVPKDNVKVEFHDGALVISGEKNSERKEVQGTRHLEERTSGVFRRWFMLPVEIDASKIQAAFENGVLRITAPKAAASKPKQIPISEGAAKEGGLSATRVA